MTAGEVRGAPTAAWTRPGADSPTSGGPRLGGRAWALIAVVCLGQFMVTVDVAIVNVALPSIQRTLGFTNADVQWVVNAYILTIGGFLLLGGRIGDIAGRRRTFLVGLGVFTAASLVGAGSRDQAMIVGARALQGLGAAVLSPSTLSLLTTSFTGRRERSIAVGAWSAMTGIGGASGVLIGGMLTDLLSWRWIFLINVPIGMVALVLARAVVPADGDGRDRPRLDALGALTVTGGLVALVAAISGTTTRPWASPVTLALLGTSGVLLGAFAVVETRLASDPLVPFGIFRSRSVTGANLTMFLTNGSQFSMWIFLTLYFQEVRGLSALATGALFAPMTLAMAVGAQVGSRLVPRMGPRPAVVGGALMSTGGLAWESRLVVHGSLWPVPMVGGTIAALGMGLTLTALAFAATTGVPAAEAGLASGILNSSRQLGASIGIAALVTLAVGHARALGAQMADTTAAHHAAAAAGFSEGFAIAAACSAASTLAALAIPRSRGRRGRPAAGAPGIDAETGLAIAAATAEL